jgi:hypothetical protein
VQTRDLNLKSASLRSQGPSFQQTSPQPCPVLDSSVLPNGIKSSWEMMETVLKSNAEWNTGFVLHPGQAYMQEAFIGTAIPMNDLRNGIAYVLVCIVYQDQFEKRHRTQDCFRLTMPNPEGLMIRFETVPAYQTAN